MYFLFKNVNFHCHVSLPEGNWWPSFFRFSDFFSGSFEEQGPPCGSLRTKSHGDGDWVLVVSFTLDIQIPPEKAFGPQRYLDV